MLQVVLFAIFIGLALVAMPPKQAQPILSLMGSLQEVCMTVVRWAMYIAPLAVFGLLAQITIKVGLDALFRHGRICWNGYPGAFTDDSCLPD
jgi:Na+/H+-dicarboxylate symporter